MIFLAKLKDDDKTVSVLINAVNYTEAETKSMQICKVVCRAFSEVESITKTTFKEILLNESGINNDTVFYKAKVAYNSETNSGKIKTNKVAFVVRAANADEAYEMIKEYADGFMDDARVFGMEETDVLDYYDHEKVMEIQGREFRDLLKENKIRVSFKVYDEEPEEKDEAELIEDSPFV